MRDSRRGRLVLGVLLSVALVALTIDHRAGESSPLRQLRTAGATVLGTVQQFGVGVVRPVGAFVQSILDAPSAQRRIDALQKENAELRASLVAGRLDAGRAKELERLLGLTRDKGYKVVTANVVARRGLPGFEDSVQIDVGSADGVQPEMTVLNGDGLVGRVLYTSPHSSTVLLISDLASAVGARLEGDKEIGVVHGVGENGRLVQFRLLDSTAPLSRGGRIVSFGSKDGKPYAPGVPIGIIERVEATPGELTRIAYARPYADLTALDVVGVVVAAPTREDREAVAPKVAPKKEKQR
ncbi:rod shape-determining protein MreC [Nonomuraea maritima]|uniref:Cell shape-determining protein MreC n=1 Tax=Nonomuraea maritima TaxID=683260 RepID=A0A1G9Q3M3_9ACTN|nr:rod shape-determining protein MreC [Nonomuraea maritima]SDM05513.1 rod shape-determining protein MreC [Nonomuraea maritima]